MKTLDQQISAAKARAKAACIEVDLAASTPDGSVLRVTSEWDATITYAVTRDPEGKLTCSCPARVVCKHIGLLLAQYGVPYHGIGRPDEALPITPVPNAATGEPDVQDEEPCSLTHAEEARLAAFRRVAAWLASLEAPATVESEASIALMLVERSERTLAGQTFSQEERLRALAYLPVAIAAYAVVLGPAHAWQWHQAKEEQWDRYQACRLTQCWY